MPILPAKQRSYYDDEEEAPAQHAALEPNPEGTEGMLTAVIPTSLLKGQPFEVGDRVVLQIDSIQGDQIVVSYAEDPDEELDPQTAPGNEAMPPEGLPSEEASEVESDPLYD